MSNRTSFSTAAFNPLDKIRVSNNVIAFTPSLSVQPNLASNIDYVTLSNVYKPKPEVILAPPTISKPNIVDIIANTKPNIGITKPPVIHLPVSNWPVDKIRNQLLQLRSDLPILHLYNAHGTHHVPEDKLKVPIANNDNITDETFYRDPKSKQKKLYIPQYHLVQKKVAGKNQYQVELKQNNTGTAGTLTIYLKRQAANKIKNKIGNAVPMDHSIEVVLMYKDKVPGVADIQRKMTFQEQTIQKDGLTKVVLNIDNQDDLHQIYHAMTDTAYEANLIINRKVKVAVPAFIAVKDPKKLNPSIHKPVLIYRGEEEIRRGRSKFTKINLSIANSYIYPESLFGHVSSRPGFGSRRRSPRATLEVFTSGGKRLQFFPNLSKRSDLSSLWITFPLKQLPDKKIYVVLKDNETGKKFISSHLDLTNKSIGSNARLYNVISKVLNRHSNFIFKRNTHNYVYNGIHIGGGGMQSSYEIVRIPWKNQEHVYLQSKNDRTRILYLPDEFKLARDSQFNPWFQVKYVGNDLSNLKAEISYRLEKFVDFERIKDAAGNSAFGQNQNEDLIFESLLLPEDKLTFKLALPGSGGFKERNSALLDNLNYTIDDTIDPMSLDAFQSLFNTLVKKEERDNLFRGQLGISFENQSVPSIPLAVRFGDIGGEVFDITRAENKVLQVDITNKIVDPITASSCDIILKEGSQEIKAKVIGLPAKIQLKSNEKISLLAVVEQGVIDLEKAQVKINWKDLSWNGNPFDIQTKVQKSTKVKVRNAIESPVSVTGLNTFMQVAGLPLPAETTGIEYPLQLGPGEHISMDIYPSIVPNQMPDPKQVELMLDWQNLEVHPDPAAIYDAIVDPFIQATYNDKIYVWESADAFVEGSNIRAITVDFYAAKEGMFIGDMTITADDLKATSNGSIKKDIVLPLPVRDYVLGLESSGQYWYKITVITNETLEGEWQSETGDLFITTSKLPGKGIK